MGKTHAGQQPFRIDPEFLRLRFWEVADPASFKGYKTPFEKIRHELRRSADAVADAMHMDVDSYLEMEEGHVTPPVENIVYFCKATRTTPLDLYQPDPDDVRPLPREIFASMVTMIAPYRETCGLHEGHLGYAGPVRKTSSPHHQSMGLRLRAEYEQGGEILRDNIAHLRPLLSAIGYSRDLQNSSDPLCGTSDSAETPLGQMMKDPHGKRAFLETCLNHYQILLESEAEIRASIAARVMLQIRNSNTVMLNTASSLYGAAGVVAALMGLAGALKYSPELEEFRREFIKDPSLVGVALSASALSDSDLRIKAGMLFEAARTNTSLSRAIGQDGAAAMAARAGQVLELFLEWRNDPKTRTLLDWFENWAEIYQLTLSSAAHRDKPVPKGFPLAMPG